jgi:hypothetical protein
LDSGIADPSRGSPRARALALRKFQVPASSRLLLLYLIYSIAGIKIVHRCNFADSS